MLGVFGMGEFWTYLLCKSPAFHTIYGLLLSYKIGKICWCM